MEGPIGGPAFQPNSSETEPFFPTPRSRSATWSASSRRSASARCPNASSRRAASLHTLALRCREREPYTPSAKLACSKGLISRSLADFLLFKTSMWTTGSEAEAAVGGSVPERQQSPTKTRWNRYSRLSLSSCRALANIFQSTPRPDISNTTMLLKSGTGRTQRVALSALAYALKRGTDERPLPTLLCRSRTQKAFPKAERQLTPPCRHSAVEATSSHDGLCRS